MEAVGLLVVLVTVVVFALPRWLQASRRAVRLEAASQPQFYWRRGDAGCAAHRLPMVPESSCFRFNRIRG